MLSYSEKESIISDFPNIKLSYENIIHKKVYNADINVAIPEGKKCFAWFTEYQEKSVCFILELTDNKQITNIRIMNGCFNNDLAYGTIFYGTNLYHSYNNFFTIEDVFLYKGKDVSRRNWLEKFTLMKTIMKHDMKQISYNKSFIVFGLPVFSDNLNDLLTRIKDLKYKIDSIQFRSFHRAGNFLYMPFLIGTNEKRMEKPIPSETFVTEVSPQKSITNIPTRITNIPTRNNNIRPVNYENKNNKEKRDIVFKIKPDIQNDIYHLYCVNNNNNNSTNVEQLYNVAYIPDYTTSVMMNKLFRNIKENQNLDALEESDDEEEFENEKEDRFVDINKSYNMICAYNYKFKKWYPLRVADKNMVIASINELKNYKI